MSYASVMVNLSPGRTNGAVLQAAVEMARRFDVRVIGVAAARPMAVPYAEGYVATGAIDRDRQATAEEILAAEAEFRTALGRPGGRLDWRSVVTSGPIAGWLARELCAADLLIGAAGHRDTGLAPSHDVDLADLVMQSGRPVLLIPPSGAPFRPDRVLIGWKDSRETRRAVADALPLLRRADHVSVIEIARPDEAIDAGRRLDDVGLWLDLHGVRAEARTVPPAGRDADQLADLAREDCADLIVAGAYGRGRFSEWVLGGVTRDLLLAPERCTFLSH